MIRSAQYERNRETRTQRKQRIERARMQTVAVLTPAPIHPPAEGERWKGIVDGTEVRVSPRWKPSKQHRQHTRRVGQERKRARVYVAAKRDDRALMAQMGSIHGNTQ
jgi:hypothetical protein